MSTEIYKFACICVRCSNISIVHTCDNFCNEKSSHKITGCAFRFLQHQGFGPSTIHTSEVHQFCPSNVAIFPPAGALLRQSRCKDGGLSWPWSWNSSRCFLKYRCHPVSGKRVDSWVWFGEWFEAVQQCDMPAFINFVYVIYGNTLVETGRWFRSATQTSIENARCRAPHLYNLAGEQMNEWLCCIWVFPKIMVPQNGWFIRENPGNTHIVKLNIFLGSG